MPEVHPVRPSDSDVFACARAFANRDYGTCALLTNALMATGATDEVMQLHLLSLARLGDSLRLGGFVSKIGDLDQSTWALTLIRLTLGLTDPKAVIEQASDELQRCQARYYAGARYMTLGKLSDARREWEDCMSLKVDCLERSLAQVECGDQRLECFRDTGDEASERIALLNRQSWLLNSSGRVSEAQTFAQAAREMASKLLGEQHPRYASSLHMLALIYESRGDWIESERLYRQMIEIRRAALGEDHPNYAVALKNYARCLAASPPCYQINGKLRTVFCRHNECQNPVQSINSVSDIRASLLPQD